MAQQGASRKKLTLYLIMTKRKQLNNTGECFRNKDENVGSLDIWCRCYENDTTSKFVSHEDKILNFRDV